MEIELESGTFEVPGEGGYFLAGNTVLCVLIGGSDVIRGGFGDVVENGVPEEWERLLCVECLWDNTAQIEVFKVCDLPNIFSVSQYAI